MVTNRSGVASYGFIPSRCFDAGAAPMRFASFNTPAVVTSWAFAMSASKSGSGTDATRCQRDD
jgi:hypothetical protein